MDRRDDMIKSATPWSANNINLAIAILYYNSYNYSSI